MHRADYQTRINAEQKSTHLSFMNQDCLEQKGRRWSSLIISYTKILNKTITKISHQYRDQDPHQDLQEDADLAKNSGSSRMRLLKFSTSAITPLLDLARSIWDRNTERQFKICQTTDQKHLIVLLQQMCSAGKTSKSSPALFEPIFSPGFIVVLFLNKICTS